MSNNKQSSNHIPDVGNKVSSVEFIKNNLERLGMLDNGKVITNIFEQAKAMHKEEIEKVSEDWWNEGASYVYNGQRKYNSFDDYYKETFEGNNED